MRAILTLFCAVCAYGQPGIEVPSIGLVLDPGGSLRPVTGVAGNFLLGAPGLSGVRSAACSERLCLVKTESKIVSASGETEAPEGPAIFGIDAINAVVFFPKTNTFARWHDDVLDPLDWTVEGEVLSIRGLEIAVRREGQVWIVHPDGSLADWIARTPGPALLLADSVLFAAGDALILRRADASEVHFDMTGAEAITALAAMGPHYAAVRLGDSSYALRIDSGQEALFLLPNPAPASMDPPANLQ